MQLGWLWYLLLAGASHCGTNAAVAEVEFPPVDLLKSINKNNLGLID